MKKITLLFVLLLVSAISKAQSYYNFSHTTSTYADLTDATSINNGVAWGGSNFSNISVPFDISFLGFEANTMALRFNAIVFNSESGSEFLINPFTVETIDRNFSLTGPSLSPISYKVEGNVGQRIFKIEFKNAGVLSEADLMDPNNTQTNFYLNYQIWIYETTNNVEFHFGSNNITSFETVGFESLISGIQAFVGDIGYLAIAYGNPLDPTYIDGEMSTLDIDAITNFTSMTAENTVYRFETSTLSNKDKEKMEFVMYPIPTAETLNFVFSENLDKKYSVYDLLGREVLNGKFENVNQAEISVQHLQTGTYILKVGGTTKKFIKK